MDATATTTGEIANESTARASLTRVKDDLAAAVIGNRDATANLRQAVVDIRPLGLLTVDEMAVALDRDRNYVDSVWSGHGETVKGRQTRVPVTEEADANEAREAFKHLARLAHKQRRTQSTEKTARAERDRAVTMVYNSRILGPSAIAAEVGIDRNHVLRIARRNGVGPAHRPGTKNQHTAK